MRNKILIWAVIISMIFPFVGGAVFAENPKFTDTKGHWAEKTIQKAHGLGLVAGYDDQTFRPDKKVARSEFLVLMLGVLESAGIVKGYAENTTDFWAEKYYLKGIEIGLISKSEYGSDDPKVLNAPISRGEMVDIIARLAGVLKLPMEQEIPNLKDLGSLQGQRLENAQIALQAGLISGYSDNTLSADKTSSRAEAATITLKAHTLLAGRKAEKKESPSSGIPSEWKLMETADIIKHKPNSYLAPAPGLRWLIYHDGDYGSVVLIAVNDKNKVIAKSATRPENPDTTEDMAPFIGEIVIMKSGERAFIDFVDKIDSGKSVFTIEFVPSYQSVLFASPTNSSEIKGYEDMSHELVNIVRKKYGLGITRFSEAARRYGQNYAERMGKEDFFGHDSPDGESFSERVQKDKSLVYTRIGENLALNYETPFVVINGWINSKDHRDNILEPKFEYHGIGIDIGKGKVIAVQLLFR